ncbi:MAG: exodeoxyribonuclease V subunit gamma, partial [Candidatus Binatia bacterium]
VRSRREQLRAARREGREADASALHFDVGNPLLADDGKLARDFQGIIEGLVDYEEDARELSGEPGDGSMLAVLQSDALALAHRGAKGGPPRLAVDPADRSIEVHACHSPMREVEVLRDRLLACFDTDPKLAPRDVIVMTPSIERYAPFVEAALGGGIGGEPRIPFRVTDRAVRATDGAVAAFLRVLEAIGGRFTAPEIVDLLELAPIRDRFEIDAAELDVIQRWVARSGIRWGVDAAHRAEVGQPADAQNTWEFGLDRLFVGYATRGEDEGRLFAGRLPFDGVEGTEAATLGRLAHFVDTLARFRAAFARERPVGEWAADLLELVAATVRAPGGDELVRLRSAIAAVGGAAA